MTAPPAAKRARASALDAAVSTLEVPGLGQPQDMFVMADGTRLFSTDQHTLQLLTPAGWLTNIAGSNDDDQTFVDGQRPAARFNGPASMTVDAAGHIVVVDYGNNALRRVSKAGEVSTLAGNGESGFADGQGEAARFNEPEGVELAANDELVVADTENHAIKVVTPASGGAVRTLCVCPCLHCLPMRPSALGFSCRSPTPLSMTMSRCLSMIRVVTTLITWLSVSATTISRRWPPAPRRQAS
jgi:hypothetical protein